MSDFNPNQTLNSDDGIFGLPFNEDSAQLCLIPVPWDLTTSYGKGSAKAPQAIRQESVQIDLFDIFYQNIYEKGIFLNCESIDLQELNLSLHDSYFELTSRLETSPQGAPELRSLQEGINEACEKMNQFVYEKSVRLLSQDKLVAVVGGDHSSPYGLIKALSEKHKGNFSILQIDAHADLRVAYQGLKYSHASIMYNCLQLENPPQLLQVGIRDFCEDEYRMIESHSHIKCLFDRELKTSMFSGTTWNEICDQIVENLGEQVYISFDVDGLDPSLCPNTGTPVPGGLNFDMVVHLLNRLSQKKKIIGFDLCEVSPGKSFSTNLDANIGARLLYLMSCASLYSAEYL